MLTIEIVQLAERMARGSRFGSTAASYAIKARAAFNIGEPMEARDMALASLRQTIGTRDERYYRAFNG